MADRHVSVPRPFSNGDIGEWFQKFEICSRANGWDDAQKALKLPTLLEGEALAIWLEMTEVHQGEIKTVKETLVSKMTPVAFVALDVFHRRTLQPGEALAVYVHELKKLLEQAMPDLTADAREKLVLHQFLTGLPGVVSRQLRATGEAKTLSAAVERARLLMAIGDQGQVSAVADKPSAVEQLTEQVARLTEQVAALSTTAQNTSRRERIRCFSCNRTGHVQRECPYRRQGAEVRRCYICDQRGHLAKDCQSGNDQGVPTKGSRYPHARQ